jgi:hypothetical protein
VAELSGMRRHLCGANAIARLVRNSIKAHIQCCLIGQFGSRSQTPSSTLEFSILISCALTRAGCHRSFDPRMPVDVYPGWTGSFGGPSDSDK